MHLRLASYNVEWFNALVDDMGNLLEDDQPSARFQTTRATQIAALGQVFQALDADGIMVIESPDNGSLRSTTRALESFAKRFGLRARTAVHGFTSETEQEIAFLFDPDRLMASHAPQGAPSTAKGAYSAPRFDTTLRLDLDGDGAAELMTLSKPPLELLVQVGDKQLRLIGVHAKSKAPHGRASPADYIRISIENRRKQLAECMWIRGRVETVLAAGIPLIIMGDFNDGPGLDEYETLFGQSGVEIVLGLNLPKPQQLFDPHAAMALTKKLGILPTTARFWLAPQNRFFEALIDFVMVSQDIAATSPVWRIWHPLNDPAMTPQLRDAVLAASDHFPVSIDLEI